MKNTQFDFIAGSDALCLVDTLGGRGGEVVERLGMPGDLIAWFEAAGLLPPGCRATQADLDHARALREAIHRCGGSVISGASLPAADVRHLNRVARQPPLRPQMIAGKLTLRADDPIGAALSTLAADALTLFGSEQRGRVRVCPGCRMMFVDTSRPGRRRWCSSSSGCGNQAKLRKRRTRQGGNHTVSRSGE